MASPVFDESYAGVAIQRYNDILQPPKPVSTSSTTLGILDAGKSLFISVFLPQGYPHTVTVDYAEYQVWDTLQAFASSLTGALATSAVLKGVGVGNQEANVLAASLTWVMKDGIGMIGRIVFAWARGSQLDSNCKKWRLVADILNDAAFGFELLAPHLSPVFFPPLACTSSILRSIVGVAGGATRTAVTRHQARRENLADVAAKDGSQETLVNVISLVVSMVMLPAVDQAPRFVPFLAAFFVFVHIFANYKAVTSLLFDTFNQTRLAYCVRAYIDGYVPAVAEANKAEPLFRRLGPRRKFGCSLSTFSKMGKPMQNRAKNDRWIAAFQESFQTAAISISTDANGMDQLDSAIAVEFCSAAKSWPSARTIEDFKKQAVSVGWILESHQLDYDEWRYTTAKKSE